MLEGYAEPEDMARERESSERPRRFVVTRIESYISTGMDAEVVSYLASGSRARWGDYAILRAKHKDAKEAFAAMRARRPGF